MQPHRKQGIRSGLRDGEGGSFRLGAHPEERSVDGARPALERLDALVRRQRTESRRPMLENRERENQDRAANQEAVNVTSAHRRSRIDLLRKFSNSSAASRQQSRSPTRRHLGLSDTPTEQGRTTCGTSSKIASALTMTTKCTRALDRQGRKDSDAEGVVCGDRAPALETDEAGARQKGHRRTFRCRRNASLIRLDVRVGCALSLGCKREESTRLAV
jgi:hypothetical protein